MALLLLLRNGSKPVPLESGTLLLALNLAAIREPLIPETDPDTANDQSVTFFGDSFRSRYTKKRVFLSNSIGIRTNNDTSIIDIEDYDIEDEEELVLSVISLLFKTGIL